MITRSIGIHPGVPWNGPLPGGGYQGKTECLDCAIQRFAKWLKKHFDRPVQIRFNSDRLSGGAYLRPATARGEIGLSAQLVISESIKRKRDRAWKNGTWRSLPALEAENCWTEETPLRYAILIAPEFLHDPDNLGKQEPGSRFGYWTVKTPQEAYRLLKRLYRSQP